LLTARLGVITAGELRPLYALQKMPETLFTQCRELFKRLDLLENNICKYCEAEIKAPLLPWHIGEDYEGAQDKLVFVGKPHRGEPGKKLSSGVLDARELATDLYFNSSWAYWSYTREIISQVYGDAKAGWENVALLNAVKCTSTHSTDKTSYRTAASCIDRLEVLPRELAVLEPTMIVFYTWHFHRDLFAKPFLDNDYAGYDEVTSPRHKVPCKSKEIGWWHRVFETSWCNELPVLVVSHPERKGKPEYVSLLTEWVQANCRECV
jgi:hypothetical protein